MLKIGLNDFEYWLYFKNSYARASLYRTCYNEAYSYFEQRDFTKEHCEGFMYTIHVKVEQNTLSPSAYNNYLKALKLLIKASQCNFILDLKRKKTEQGHIQTLEHSEAKAQLAHAFTLPHHYRQAVAYQLAIEHGLRFENIRNLTWDNVFPDQIHIEKTKTNNSYDIEISEELYDKIMQLQGNHEMYVFGEKRGQLNRSRFNQFVRRCITATGIKKNISAHKLRHTNATLQAEEGVNMKVISENLGHRSIKTTEGYIHVNRSVKRKAIRKLRISKHTLSSQEVQEMTDNYVRSLNEGGCQAFQIPQNNNIVITVPKVG